jgi:hypothetical protein
MAIGILLFIRVHPETIEVSTRDITLDTRKGAANEITRGGQADIKLTDHGVPGVYSAADYLYGPTG